MELFSTLKADLITTYYMVSDVKRSHAQVKDPAVLDYGNTKITQHAGTKNHVKHSESAQEWRMVPYKRNQY